MDFITKAVYLLNVIIHIVSQLLIVMVANNFSTENRANVLFESKANDQSL